jgi:hypothetical protein
VRCTSGRAASGSREEKSLVGILAAVMPNPSIEGMPKRLRLLCTPHVKR